MYLFSFKYGNGFGKYYRVFKTEEKIGNPGDLVKIQDDIVLLLWEEISFPEKYEHRYPLSELKNLKQEKKEKVWLFQEEVLWNETSPSDNDAFENIQDNKKTSKTEILFPQLFDESYLNLLHRMVLERFSDYKSVIKYFIPLEIEDLLKREPSNETIKKTEQNLYVFPDNRTRFNFLATHYKDDQTHLQLFSTDTDNKKNKHRRMIRYGLAKHIFVTQSEIFQPYQNLKKIYFIDSYKRYYHNQQDPRYSIETVIEKLKEIYHAEVEILDFKTWF